MRARDNGAHAELILLLLLLRQEQVLVSQLSRNSERDPPLPPKLAAIHWIFFVSILEVHAQASLARLGFAYLGGFSISPSPRAEVRRGRTSLGRSVGYGSRNLHFFALKKGGAARRRRR